MKRASVPYVHICVDEDRCPARCDRGVQCSAAARSRVLWLAFQYRKFLDHANECGEMSQRVVIRRDEGRIELTRQDMERSLQVVRPVAVAAHPVTALSDQDQRAAAYRKAREALEIMVEAFPLSAFPHDKRRDPEDAAVEHLSALGLAALLWEWDEDSLPLLSDRFRKAAGKHLRANLRPWRVRKGKPTGLAIAEDVFARARRAWEEHSFLADASEEESAASEESLDHHLAEVTPRQREHIETVRRHLRDRDEPALSEAKQRAARDLGIGVKAIDMTFSRLRRMA